MGWSGGSCSKEVGGVEALVLVQRRAAHFDQKCSIQYSNILHVCACNSNRDGYEVGEIIKGFPVGWRRGGFSFSFGVLGEDLYSRGEGEAWE